MQQNNVYPARTMFVKILLEAAYEPWIIKFLVKIDSLVQIPYMYIFLQKKTTRYLLY